MTIRSVQNNPSTVAITGGTIGGASVESIGLRNTIRSKGYAKISFMGDSFTAITTSTSGSITDSSAYAYANHVQALSRGRLMVGKASGSSGATTAQIAVDLPAFLVGNADDAVFWFTGANDITSATPDAAAVTAALLGVAGVIRAAGKIPILATVMPRTPQATSAAQVAARFAINNALRVERDAGRLLLVDWEYLYQQSDGTIPTTTSYDGTHPNPLGAERMAQVIVDYLLPGGTASLNAAMWAPVGAPNTNVTNGILAGTGGSLAKASVTGQVATSWLADGGNAAGDSTVCSKVASTDADPTEWQQIVVTAGAGGSNISYLQQFLPTGQSGSISWACEVEVTAPDDSSLINYFIRVQCFAGATQTAQQFWTAGPGMTGGTRRLVLKTPAINFATADTANAAIYIGCRAATSKSVTMKIRRVGRISF